MSSPTKWSSSINFLFTILGISLCFNSNGQNLIPNASFEDEIPSAMCARPDASFGNLANWYGLNLNPDFFSPSCDFDDADFIYWDQSTTASSGSNYIGLWSRWNSDETYKSEGIAVELNEALLPGETYVLEMQVVNRGEFQGLSAVCILKPNKHIDVYLSEDSIKIDNNFSEGTAFTTTPRAAVIQSDVITSAETDGWETVSVCFTAQGGEKYLALILPLGDFGNLPSCAATMGTSGVFRSFYYFIDDVSLTTLSEDLTMDTLVCEQREFIADLPQIFQNEFLQGADFEWDDGGSGSYRVFEEPRNFQINAVTNCGNLPMTLNVTAESCNEAIYMPTVFDPTVPGINSMLRPLNISEENISNYRFSVFDRWGSKVFSTNNPNQGWNAATGNGTYPQGIYTWFLSYEVIELNKPARKTMQGAVTLVL